MSFEEANPLTEKQKHEIIEEFEKTLLPGLDQEQYNILWVEHTDKGRLELNFVIPKIELTTQKALTPYYHKQDFSRIEMFEDICNIKYNLTSKKDPSKAQTLLGSKKEINLIKDYKELDETLLELVAAQQLRSREQLIETLKESGIEVTRAGKDYLSLKLPESKKAKKFKGGIYAEQFTSLESLEDISREAEQRAREYNNRDTQKEYEAISKRLERYNQKKAIINRERYKQSDGRYSRGEQMEVQTVAPLDSDRSNSVHISTGGSSDSGLHTKKSAVKGMASAKKDAIRTRWSEVHQEQQPDNRERQQNNIHQDRGIIDDSIRTTIERRTREREKILTEARNPIIYESRNLQSELIGIENRVYRQLERYEEITREVVEQRYEPLQSRAREVVQERQRQRGLRERFREAIDSVRDGLEQFKADILSKFRSFRGEFAEDEEQSNHFAQGVREYKEQLDRDNEPDYSYSMRM